MTEEIQGHFWYDEQGRVVAHFQDGSRPFTTRFTKIDDLLADIGWRRIESDGGTKEP